MAITVQPDDPNKSIQPGPQKQGSGFTNIDRYTQANQGNRLGDAVGSGVQQTGDQTRQAIGAGQSQFQQQANASNLDTDQNRQAIGQMVQDPTKATDQDAQKFAQYRSGQYTGPQGIANQDQLQAQAQQAQQLGQSTQDAGGRLALLQRFAANPTQGYSSGQSRFDATLLGQTGMQGLRQARQATIGLTGQLDQASQAAQAQAQEYQAKAKGLADYTNQQIAGQRDPLTNQLTTQAQKAEADRDSAIQKYQQDFAAGKVSKDELNALGLGDLAGQQTYGQDLSRFINASSQKADALGVASQDQAARLNALAKLGGTDQFGDASQAGSFLKNQFNVDKDSIQKQLQQAGSEYNSRLNPLQSSINSDLGLLTNKNQLNADRLHSMAQALGVTNDNYQFNPDADGGGTTTDNLTADQWKQMADKYASMDGQSQKGIREDILGRGLGGDVRDPIANSLNDYTAKQAALRQLQQQYNIGNTLGS